ncbi:MAG: CCA tRNA nucleotidyltransferase [Bacteroidota bacterium]|jgi:poly(A) polymerase
MEAHAMFLKDPVFRLISSAADELGLPTYVIGGYVRDCFLQRKSRKDIDVMCVGSGIELAQKVAAMCKGNPELVVYKNFGTALLKTEDHAIEFVGARKESYRHDTRKPLVEDGSLQDDQARRDFTINTLGLSLNAKTFGALLNESNGLQDLHAGIIRTPADPDITFSDDPLRMMRAVRFACQLHFTIVPECIESIRRNAHRISIVSTERITDELNKIILSTLPSRGFILLDECGILEKIFPQFLELKVVESIGDKSHKDNFYHTLQVLDNVSEVSQDLWLRWAAILHDIAKPATKRFIPEIGWTFHGHEDRGARMVPGIFRNLKLPMGDNMRFVQQLVQLHLRPIVLSQEHVTDSAVRRLLFDAGDALDALMILCRADITSKNKEKVRRHLRNFNLVQQKLKEVEAKDNIRNWKPPVDGNEIMQLFSLPPGKAVGMMKNRLKDAILDGEIPNKREEALQFLHALAASGTISE